MVLESILTSLAVLIAFFTVMFVVLMENKKTALLITVYNIIIIISILFHLEQNKNICYYESITPIEKNYLIHKKRIEIDRMEKSLENLVKPLDNTEELR